MSATQGYVPGPTQVYVGVGVSGAFEFLGWSEDGVQLQLLAENEDIISDFGGPAVPVDSQFMGEHGYSSFTLNRYDEAVLQILAKRRVGSGVTAGAIEANGIGSLYLAEGYAFQTLFLCPYRTKSFQSGSIVPCYLFQSSWLNAEFMVPLSTRLKRPRCILRHIPVWNAVAGTALLYTNVVPSPVPTPD